MTLASLLTALLLFALCGYIVYVIVTYIPMPAPFSQALVVVCVVVLVLYLISILSGGSVLPVFRSIR